MNAIYLMGTLPFLAYFVPVLIGIWYGGVAFLLAIAVAVVMGDWSAHALLESLNITTLLVGMHPFGHLVAESGLIHKISAKMERYRGSPWKFYGFLTLVVTPIGALADAVTGSIVIRHVLHRFGLTKVIHAVFAVALSAYLATWSPLGDTVTMQGWLAGHSLLVIATSAIGMVGGVAWLLWYASTSKEFVPESDGEHDREIEWSLLLQIVFLAICIAVGKVTVHLPGPALLLGWVVLFSVIPDYRHHAVRVLGNGKEMLKGFKLGLWLQNALAQLVATPVATIEKAWSYTGNNGTALTVGVLIIIAAGMAGSQPMQLTILDHVIFGAMSAANENNTLMALMLRQDGIIVALAALLLNAGGTGSHIGCLSSMEATSTFSGKEKAEWITKGWKLTVPAFGLSAAVQVAYTKWEDLCRWTSGQLSWLSIHATQLLEGLGLELNTPANAAVPTSNEDSAAA